MINRLFETLAILIKNEKAAVVLFAILPFSEARLAIPIALKFGIPPFKAFLLSFLGSSAAAVIMPLCLLPLIRLFTKVPLIKKLANSILTKADEKAERMEGKKEKSDLKKMLAICGFVSLPLPLTGVYMGSLLAAVLHLKYPKALLSLLTGNLITSIIITVTGVYFAAYIDRIVTVFTLLALFAIALMLLKAFLPKRKKKVQL